MPDFGKPHNEDSGRSGAFCVRCAAFSGVLLRKAGRASGQNHGNKQNADDIQNEPHEHEVESQRGGFKHDERNFRG